MNDETFNTLVANQHSLYELQGRIGARPAANFIGFRAGLPCVSVSCSPLSVPDMVDKFTAAAMVLASLQADEACLAVGDEWAETVLHPDELPVPADGYAAVVVAGHRPRGVVRPYAYDRGAGKLSWGPPARVRLSLNKGMWGEILAPQCLGDEAPGRRYTSAVAEVVALNEELGNDVLVLNEVAGSIGAGNTLN